jgi:hypothetical protein
MRTSLPTVRIVEDNGLLRYDIVEAFRAGGWDVWKALQLKLQSPC